MYITVTLRTSKSSYHVQADDNQPIWAVAAVLDETLGVFGRNGLPRFLKSEIQRGIKSSSFTFRQAGIRNGDILTMVEKGSGAYD